MNREPYAPEVQAILARRARELARPPAAPAGASLELVQFQVGGETYALAAAAVREVLPLRDLLPLPGTPAFVLGIVNVRGRILSVVDLKRFFGLPVAGLTDSNRLLVLGDDELEFGLLADRVLGTALVPLAQLQPPLATMTGVREEYLRGVTATGLVVLDADRLIGDSRLIVE